MRHFTKDSWPAAILFAVGLALVFVTPYQVTGQQTGRVGSATLPVALAYGLVVLSALLFIFSLRRDGPVAPIPAPAVDRLGARIGSVLGLILGMAAYVALIAGIGYVIATALLMVFLALLFGERRWLIIVLLAVLVPLGLQIFFQKVMIIYLPGATWI